MSADTAADQQVGARALRAWISGERDDCSRVILVERDVAAGALGRLVGEGDVILLPAESDPVDAPTTTVFYRGDLNEIGDELFLGDRAVELQDYVAAAFIQIVGPTAVCLVDDAGWQAFFDDADIARRTGVFPSALLDPRVLLANRVALEEPDAMQTPHALRVAADGRISVGVHGEVIGRIDDPPSVLDVPVPRAAALGGITARSHEDLARRGWIGRYLRATDLMKMLRLTNGAADIAGFGWSALDDDRADAEPLSADPFLLRTADGYVLADTTSLRRQLLSPMTATVVAAVQTSRSVDVAADRVARRLRMPSSGARGLCEDAIAALRVHCGRTTTGIASPRTGIDR